MFYKLEGVIIMNQFQFFKLLFFLFLVLFIYQCEDAINDPALNDSDSATLLKGGNGRGGGGNGGGGGGGNGGGTDYGDLVVCLRTADGVPIYLPFAGENSTEYLPYPIKFDDTYGKPVTDVNSYYATFDYDEEGVLVEEEGFFVKEADFGRTSLTRSPQRVLDAALAEAIVALTQNGVTNITTDASGRLVAIIGAEDWVVNFDDIVGNEEDNDKTIDSPRENMAIYQSLMGNGLSELAAIASYFSADDVMNLAVGALAAAGDKTGNISVDEIAYMNDWVIDWELLDEGTERLFPDEKDRNYFNYAGFSYDRQLTYEDKYVRITTLNPDGSWSESYESLYDVTPWTSPSKLVDWANGQNTNITGFANAADDAVQVLEFIHSSDLIVYSPHFPLTP